MTFAATPRTLVLLAAFLSACFSMGPKVYDTDDAYRTYVQGLHLSGVTAQAAMAKARSEGYACRTSGGVIKNAPQELVVLCQRGVSNLSCKQDQSIVLQLDWVGTPKPEMAPGMRVRDVGSVATPRDCS